MWSLIMPQSEASADTTPVKKRFWASPFSAVVVTTVEEDLELTGISTSLQFSAKKQDMFNYDF